MKMKFGYILKFSLMLLLITGASKLFANNSTITKAMPEVTCIAIKDSGNADTKLTSREMQMVDEINLLRSNPASYAQYITDYLQRTGAGKKTTKVANELMAELNKTASLNTLNVSPNMYFEVTIFGRQLLQTNMLRHSTLHYTENLCVGIQNIRDAVILLLLDEGIEGRGHRKNLLKKNLSQIAVHEIPGKVADFDYCFIQVFK
jgi:hypothetical protein